MPMNKSRYPKDWDRISKAIRHREGYRCGLCGAPNGEELVRLKECAAIWERTPVLAKIAFTRPFKCVLTVHHINYNTRDNRPQNLVALCQRCHLRLDLPYKLLNRKNQKEAVR